MTQAKDYQISVHKEYNNVQVDWAIKTSKDAINVFEDIINQNDINEPYVINNSQEEIAVGFWYDPDMVVTLKPAPIGYTDNINYIIEKINYLVEVGSIS